ncbi:MAG TPA: MFS transporter [Ignavibacteriaceae bacterium]|nr:MFS transporter [Ignavibacteriaceae bacterium]
MQMAGMLIGGIIWGIWGDKKGRLSVLFGSITLYSISNFANAFVTSTELYALLRFLAGIGLAGELGAAVTLISETMPKESRGFGTTIVASVGVTGAVGAFIVGDLFSWHTAYIVGGILGFLLLILRIRMFESGMYKEIEKTNISKGNFLKLFTSKERFFRYINCIATGLPIWFVVGILITFSPEFGKILNVRGNINAGRAVMFTYIGLIAGDLGSGLLSQMFKSRKKIVMVFIVLTFIFILIYLFSNGLSSSNFYILCLALGVSIGYWAVFVTIASEQFGTNLRSTVTTTVPNFIRGSVIPITYLFEFLRGSLGMIYSALIVGLICTAAAYISINKLKESYGNDLNYIEQV